MKALSLWQPWASAMAVGSKVIETRSWPTKHRGPVLIHAALRLNKTEMAELEQRPEWMAALRPLYPHGSFASVLPFGCIVAVGNLVDCVPTNKIATPELFTKKIHRGEPSYPHWCESQMGNFAHGRFGWVFRDIERIDVPLPWKGAQGLFEIPAWDLKGCVPDSFLIGGKR